MSEGYKRYQRRCLAVTLYTCCDHAIRHLGGSDPAAIAILQERRDIFWKEAHPYGRSDN
jgi:hypothetical protein